MRQGQRVFFVGTIEANQVLVTSDNHFILVLYNTPESNIGWIPNAPASRLSFNDPGDSGDPFGRIGGWQLKSTMTVSLPRSIEQRGNISHYCLVTKVQYDPMEDWGD